MQDGFICQIHRRIRWRMKFELSWTTKTLAMSCDDSAPCRPQRPYKLVLSPNRIMQLLSPSNILFFLLFSFFARSSPIGGKPNSADDARTVSDSLIESNSNRLPSKQKQELIEKGAFLDVVGLFHYLGILISFSLPRTLSPNLPV
jgi:hypothetical protein